MARKTRSGEDVQDEFREDLLDEVQDDAEAETAPEVRIAALQRRCEELDGLWKRAQADYQNLRRRAVTETDAAVRREIQPLLEELLLVLDFLEMALSSAAESEDARNLALGVEMTRTKLVQALEAAGVESIPTEGLFDPRIHEAVQTRRDENAEPGTVVETVRKGYRWHGHVLRPARVVVAAGDDDASPEAEGQDEPTS